jgi:hypothetical protein
LAFLTLKTEDGSFDEEFEAKITVRYPLKWDVNPDGDHVLLIHAAKELRNIRHY